MALRAAGFHVTVVCPALPGLSGRDEVEGVQVVRVRYAPKRLETLAATGSMYKEASGFKRLLVLPMLLSMTRGTIRELRGGPVIVYGHWWMPGGLVAVISAQLSRCPSIVHVHGSDLAVTSKRFRRWLARLVLRLADIRLAVGNELAMHGQAICDADIQVLPMPLNFASLPAPSPIPTDGCLLAVGRLVPEKGFDVLLDAVALMNCEERPELVIVGSGPEQHNLSEHAKKIGVDLRLEGAVSPDELAHWYRKSSVVVVPSLREGFGLVAAEAAASGRAVVATSVGSASELVEHGYSGLVVKPGDAHQLFEALQDIDPLMGVNGPQKVAHLREKNHGLAITKIWDELHK